MAFKFNEHGVCENPHIVWRGIYNTYGGKSNIHPLYGVSFVSVAKKGNVWMYGYSVGTQDWMSIGGCGRGNGQYKSEKAAAIAGLRYILERAKEQMTLHYPIPEEKTRLRSLILDIKEEIFNQKQLRLF